MAESEYRGRKRKADHPQQRLWAVPPPPAWIPGEQIEGESILQELPDAGGVALWQTLRDLRLWAVSPDQMRWSLFRSDPAPEWMEDLRRLAAGAPRLQAPLTVLASIRASGGRLDAHLVSLKALEVAEWARGAGALGTALHFAQAAALFRPAWAQPAYEAGTIALAWGRDNVADTWLRRAWALARRERDWPVYADALLALGEVMARRNDAEAAARYYAASFRAARRHGLTTTRGRVRWRLAQLAIRAERWPEAQMHARAALRLLRDSPELAPCVVHDLAFALLRGGDAPAAVALVSRWLRLHPERSGRPVVLAVAAHAAALAGDWELLAESWAQAYDQLLEAPESDERVRALLELAHAAAVGRDSRRALAAARAAEQGAIRLKLEDAIREAQGITSAATRAR